MQKSVEEYLQEVEKQLASLPAGNHASELRELRSHIEQIIEQFMAEGHSEAEATVAALNQFGDARQLGQGLKQAHAPNPSNWLLARLLLAFLGAMITEICLYGSYSSFYYGSGTWGLTNWSYLWGNAHIYNAYIWPKVHLFNLVFVLSGFFAGWVAEVITPRRAIWSLLALGGLRIALIVANPITVVNHNFNVALVVGAVLLANCIGTRLRQWQTRRQFAIV